MGTSFPDTCKKAFVTEQELFEGLRCGTYEALHARVGELVAQKRLSPVRSSGVNGRIPSLFNRYRVIRASKPAPSYRHEITSLHASLHIEGYLAEPARYAAHRELLLPLSDALGRSPDWFSSRMSLNEKSFLLYGDEKRLVRGTQKSGSHPGLQSAFLVNVSRVRDAGALLQLEPRGKAIRDRGGRQCAGS